MSTQSTSQSETLLLTARQAADFAASLYERGVAGTQPA